MKKNVIISSVVSSLLVAWMVGLSASANDTSTWNIVDTFKKGWFERFLWDFHDRGWDFEREWFERGWDFKKGRGWFMKWLTDEERTKLKSMSKEEKKSFFETKKAERNADREAKKIERQAYNNVIDKLLAWETLTADEETLRTKIIKLRAERKADMESREAEREEMKKIIEKKKSWETLTSDEETKLNEMKGKREWKMRGEKWWEREWKMGCDKWWERGNR